MRTVLGVMLLLICTVMFAAMLSGRIESSLLAYVVALLFATFLFMTAFMLKAGPSYTNPEAGQITNECLNLSTTRIVLICVSYILGIYLMIVGLAAALLGSRNPGALFGYLFLLPVLIYTMITVQRNAVHHLPSLLRNAVNSLAFGSLYAVGTVSVIGIPVLCAIFNRPPAKVIGAGIRSVFMILVLLVSIFTLPIFMVPPVRNIVGALIELWVKSLLPESGS